jgi:hypothetical protein
MPHVREIGEPVERAFDVRRREARTLERARKVVALGHLRRLRQHVVVEHVNKNVENGTGHGFEC